MNLPPEVIEALRRGHKIEAIKLLRKKGGIGLAEAKSLVEWHAREPKPLPGAPKVREQNLPPTSLPPEARPRNPNLSPGEVPKGGGALAAGLLLVVAVIAAIYFLR